MAKRFASLSSEEGRAALARALEASAVRRVAEGSLTVDDLLGMTQPQIDASFNLVRWPDTKGEPICPRCKTGNPYRYSRSYRMCCRNPACGHDFTATSGTVLSSRKMPLRNYLFCLSLVLDTKQFRSILRFTQELKLGYKSAFDLINKIRTCTANDDGGCTVPVTILDRATWAVRREALRGTLNRLMVLPRRSGRIASADLPFVSKLYPYLPEASPIREGDAASLMLFVDSMVPRGLPDYVRADVCQDMIVAILAGEASRDSISRDQRAYLTKVMRDSPWKYKWVSFDAPVGHGDDRPLIETFADPKSLELA